MTARPLIALLVFAAIGAALALIAAYFVARRVPRRLVRTNLGGRPVPAVLGLVVLAGGLPLPLLLLIPSDIPWYPGAERIVVSIVVVTVLLGLAGLWDDLRGDERPRGFKGHLGAIKVGRLTGGLVKLLAGGAAGLVAGYVTADGVDVVGTGLLVALTANLVNLLARAPGRAGKVALVAAVALLAAGDTRWGAATAGLFGALAVALPLDLREQAMLGDSGANPIGGLLGLGLALSLPPGFRWGAIVVLVLLNLASERYSFSRIIEGNAFLKRLDMLGRTGHTQNANSSDG